MCIVKTKHKSFVNSYLAVNSESYSFVYISADDRIQSEATGDRSGVEGASYTALTAFIGAEDDLQKYIGHLTPEIRQVLSYMANCLHRLT